MSGYGLILTPKVNTTDAEGVNAPTAALIVPADPVAGAVTVLAGVVAAGLPVLMYVVDDGVASLRTRLTTPLVPLFVAVMR